MGGGLLAGQGEHGVNMDGDLYWGMTSALAIALLATSLFVLAGVGWLTLTNRFQYRRVFADQILFEAGHRFREQLQELDARHWLYLSGVPVFLLLLFTVLLLRPPPPLVTAPAWVWMLTALLLFLVSLYLPYEIFRLRRARTRLAFWRDANMAVGHALQRTTAKGNRVFHNVRTGNRIIDNVVVGANGVYAVNVFAREGGSREDSEVRLRKSYLSFDGVKINQPVARAAKTASQLSRELSELIGHAVKVRSVIAVPGWRIGSSKTGEHLLVNEKTAVMLTGWTDTGAYLMNEDVEVIFDHLAKKCCSGARPTP